MNESKTWSGAMEGRGAYNRHAGLQAAGGALALNALRHAAASVALDTGGQPIVIAEYGASQGRNSQLPMRVAITELRARVGADRAVLVYHEDLPINDFGSLSRCWSRPRIDMSATTRTCTPVRSAGHFTGACFRRRTCISDGARTPRCG